MSLFLSFNPDHASKTYPSIRFCVLSTLFFSLSGCAQYQSQPLTKEAIEQQLQTPDIQQLTVRATAIKHPVLKPVAFNLHDGLSPDEAALVAVLLNPHLRVARDQHNIANAQLLKAGLLPDPQLSYTFAAPSGGTDLGMNNAFGVGLNWQVTALIWRANKINAAELQRQNIDLHIAWQEWQIAQAAKLAAYQLIIYHRQEALLRTMAQRLEENRSRLQQAADAGLVTELERVAAVSAKNLADNRLLALTQQKRQQQKRLNRAMGLQPDEVIPLQADINLDEPLTPPDYEDLIHNLENRRLDLLALQRGYASQDEQVHASVQQAIPELTKLVKAYRMALEAGQVDVLNYYLAWNKLTHKKVQLLTLTLQLIKARIALEVASGVYQIT